MSVKGHKGSRDEVDEATRRSCCSHNPSAHHTNHTCRYQTNRVYSDTLDGPGRALGGLTEVI
jgi:hypothetical protein